MAKNYYEILGVTKSASDDEIKNAFRKLSLKYHPDRQNGKSDSEKKDAEEKFKEIAEAYSILSDKDKRKQYDTYGTVNDSGFSGMTVDDIFRHFKTTMGFDPFGGGDDDFFSNIHFYTHNSNRVKKGKSIKLNIRITMQEAYNLSAKTVAYDRDEPCSHCHGKGYDKNGSAEKCSRCNGTGMVTNTYKRGFSVIQQSSVCPICNGSGMIIKNPCHYCNGSGVERRRITRTIQIPVNIYANPTIAVSQGGNYPGMCDGAVGDLIVSFIIYDDKFSTVGTTSDVITSKNVSVIDCILGGEQLIEGVDGKTYKFMIKPCTTDGTKYVLNGKGLHDINGGCGDLVINIKQLMPSLLTSDDIKLLNKLKQSKTFK